MLRWWLAESAGHFWWLVESKNVANPDFKNLKHLQNPGHLSLTEPSRITPVLAAYPVRYSWLGQLSNLFLVNFPFMKKTLTPQILVIL